MPGGGGCKKIVINSCHYVEPSIEEQACELQEAGVTLEPSKREDSYCEYSYQGVSLGLFQSERPYFQLPGFHLSESDAEFLFFLQKTPAEEELIGEVRSVATLYRESGMPKGKMEFQRYEVLVLSPSRTLGMSVGGGIQRALEFYLRDEKNWKMWEKIPDIRKLDYFVLPQHQDSKRIVFIDAAGFDLPDLATPLKEIPIYTHNECPELVFHELLSTNGDDTPEIPGWVVKRNGNRDLVAVPRAEVSQRLGSPLNTGEIYSYEFESALMMSGWLDSMDPVRTLKDVYPVQMMSVEAFACPTVRAVVEEISNPFESCLVRYKKMGNGTKYQPVPGGDLGAITPGREYRFVGKAGLFNPDFFAKKFERPNLDLKLKTEKVVADNQCEEWRLQVAYSKKVVTPPPPPNLPDTPDAAGAGGPTDAATVDENKRPSPSSPPKDKKGNELLRVAEATGGSYIEMATPQELPRIIEDSLALDPPALHYQILFLIDVSGSMTDEVEFLGKKMDELINFASSQLKLNGQVSLGVHYYVDNTFEQPLHLDTYETLEARRQEMEVLPAAPPPPSQAEGFISKLWGKIKATVRTPEDPKTKYLRSEIKESKGGLEKAIDFIKGTSGSEEYTWDAANKASEEPWAPAGTDVARVIFALTDEQGNIGSSGITEEQITTTLQTKGIKLIVIRDINAKEKPMTIDDAVEILSYKSSTDKKMDRSKENKKQAILLVTRYAARRKDKYLPILRGVLEKERDEKLVGLAVDTLGSLKDKEATKNILRVLERSRDSYNRTRAARALYKIGEKSVVEKLKELLAKEKEISVKTEIERTIAKLSLRTE